MTDTYGQYVKLIAVNHARWGELTNVGVIMFNPDGTRLGYRVDTPDRAIMRGDLPATWSTSGIWENYFESYLAGIKDVAEVKRAHDSMGHCMSMVQLSDFGACVIRPNTVDFLFETLVLGLDTQLDRETP